MNPRFLILLFHVLSVLAPLAILSAEGSSAAKIKALYNSLDPKSVTQALAFYQLYPESNEGKLALQEAWNLLSGYQQEAEELKSALPLKSSIIDAIVSMVNKTSNNSQVILTEDELKIIEKLAGRLPNRRLQGHFARSEDEVLALPAHEIDLAHSLFLSEFGNAESERLKMLSYEALIDLMALQILVETSLNATPQEKIRAMNRFIFEEMGFRFPPHSLYAKDIDLYTFLPSVLDSRRGVCLGVSILYIALAQRLNLNLEMITPPGHIYVRYKNGDSIINIETTARGVDIDSEEYLSIETKALQERTVKDVIGLAHFNQAAAHLHQENYTAALEAYRKAALYLPEDLLLMELMGYAHLLTGQVQEGEALLRKIVNRIPDHAIHRDSMAEDYLHGHVDIEGIRAVFKSVNEKRASILEKKCSLEAVLQKYPNFRAGIFGLGVIWLQLHRVGEALKTLERYHAIEPHDPTAEYYLSIIYAERMDYPKSWEHLKNAEALTANKNYHPKVLKQLRLELKSLFPE